MTNSCKICCLVVLFVTSVTFADLNVGNWGLSAGETFRVMYQTSQRTDATSSDISYYDSLVNSWADSSGVNVYGVLEGNTFADLQFEAFLSTPSVSASSRFGHLSTKIFNTHGEVIANDAGDLLDGSVGAHRYTEQGNLGTGSGVVPMYVWTGSKSNGDIYPSYAVGSSSSAFPSAIYGSSNAGDPDWLTEHYVSTSYQHSLYAISEQLTYNPVPVPGAALLGIIGMATSAHVLRRRKRAAA